MIDKDNVPEDLQYVMDGDSDIEKLHNRLNPPGVLGVAARYFGGMSQGYYSGEDITNTDEELGMNPKYIAELLSTDDESTLSVLRLLDSVEDYDTEHPISTDLFSMEFSQEDLMSNSVSALKTIFNWSKKVAKTVFSDMTNYELVARYLAFNAANIQTLSRDRRTSQIYDNKPLVINTRIANLSVRYEPVKDVPSLLSALRIMVNVVKDYYSYNGEELLKVADRLPQLLSNIEQLESTLHNSSPARLFRSSSFRQSTDPSLHVSQHILGCHRVSIKTQSSSGVLDNRYTVRLVPSDINPRPLPAKIEFRRFPLPAMDQCLRLVIELAEYLQEINTPMIRQRRMARLERIAMVTQKVAKEIESGNFDSEHHRKVIALVNQYNDWITSPYKELYGLVCRNLRAVLNVCEINAM